MIKISVMYPSIEGGNFDLNYYIQTHVPLVREKLGKVLKGVGIEKGLSASTGIPPVYIAIGYLLVESMEEYLQALTPHSEAIRSDIQNFTNIQPIIQISQIIL